MPLTERRSKLLERITALAKHAAELQISSLDEGEKVDAVRLIAKLSEAHADAGRAADISELDAIAARTDEIGRALVAVARRT
jgi:hypothetical protein